MGSAFERLRGSSPRSLAERMLSCGCRLLFISQEPAGQPDFVSGNDLSLRPAGSSEENFAVDKSDLRHNTTTLWKYLIAREDRWVVLINEVVIY